MLEKIGFTTTESEIYELLVLHGPVTAYNLQKRCRIHSSVLYAALHRLNNKGFVSSIKKGRTKIFQAVDPEVLIKYQEEIGSELRKKVEDWKKIRTETSETETQVYEGIAGLTNLFNSLLKGAYKNELYLSFTLGEEFFDKNCLSWFNSLGRKRISLGLNVKSLASNRYKKIFERIGDWDILDKSGLKFVDFEFPQGLVIFRENIILISWRPKAKAVRIIDQHMAEQYKKFFLKLYSGK